MWHGCVPFRRRVHLFCLYCCIITLGRGEGTPCRRFSVKLFDWNKLFTEKRNKKEPQDFQSLNVANVVWWSDTVNWRSSRHDCRIKEESDSTLSHTMHCYHSRSCHPCRWLSTAADLLVWDAPPTIIHHQDNWIVVISYEVAGWLCNEQEAIMRFWSDEDTKNYRARRCKGNFKILFSKAWRVCKMLAKETKCD